jgi:hypothetical protein
MTKKYTHCDQKSIVYCNKCTDINLPTLFTEEIYLILTSASTSIPVQITPDPFYSQPTVLAPKKVADKA